MTCCVSVLFYFLISDFPEDAKWLSDEERQFIRARLRADVGDSLRNKSLTFRDVFDVLKDRECFCMLITMPLNTHVAGSENHLGRLDVLRPHCSCIWLW